MAVRRSSINKLLALFEIKEKRKLGAPRPAGGIAAALRRANTRCHRQLAPSGRSALLCGKNTPAASQTNGFIPFSPYPLSGLAQNQKPAEKTGWYHKII
jgi:hypothetical protein